MAFWDYVDADGDCWEWTGSRFPNGYGQASDQGLGTRYAHIIAWTLLVGPVPDDLQLDHRCRRRWCVNPDHLEPVTCLENLRRGYGRIGMQLRQTTCHHGHPFNEENTYVDGEGQRHCRACDRDRHRARYQARATR